MKQPKEYKEHLEKESILIEKVLEKINQKIDDISEYKATDADQEFQELEAAFKKFESELDKVAEEVKGKDMGIMFAISILRISIAGWRMHAAQQREALNEVIQLRKSSMH